jgi:hypothetical protein
VIGALQIHANFWSFWEREVLELFFKEDTCYPSQPIYGKTLLMSLHEEDFGGYE